MAINDFSYSKLKAFFNLVGFISDFFDLIPVIIVPTEIKTQYFAYDDIKPSAITILIKVF